MSKQKITFDVSVTNDLQIGFFCRSEIDAETGKLALQKLLDLLQLTEVELSNVGKIERHRDQPRLQAVHDLTHLHDHH